MPEIQDQIVKLTVEVNERQPDGSFLYGRTVEHLTTERSMGSVFIYIDGNTQQLVVKPSLGSRIEQSLMERLQQDAQQMYDQLRVYLIEDRDSTSLVL